MCIRHVLKIAAVAMLGLALRAPGVVAATATVPDSHGPLETCEPKIARTDKPRDDVKSGVIAKAAVRSGKIISIPDFGSNLYDGRRCDISSMSLAVRDNGELRDIYVVKNGRQMPDDRLSAPPVKATDRDAYIKLMVGKLQAEIALNVERRVDASGSGLSKREFEDTFDEDPVKILIYAHGGLVSHAGAVLSAESLAPVMIRDGYVPLFLIWNNDLPVSYVDRLCCTRRGSADPNQSVDKWLFIPTRLLADVGSSIFSAPENYVQQILRFTESYIDKDFDLYYLNYDEIHQDCYYFSSPNRKVDEECSHIIFPDFRFRDDISDDHYRLLLNGGENNLRTAENLKYAALLPVRVVATALLPQVGAKAWDNMVRRTRLGFDNESTLVNDGTAPPIPGIPAKETTCHDGSDVGRIDESLACPRGGFTLFFNEITPYLADVDKDDPTRSYVTVPTRKYGAVLVPVTIEYYGHSMGAIVGDELISRYPGFPWSKVVYMAAADTIRGFKTMATVAIDEDPDRKLTFYDLSLHPLAETREKELGGAVPQGSLLEWIDEMFNVPRTADDRTLGKWKNVEATLPTWRTDILMRTTFRVFPAQNNLRKSKDADERAMFESQCDPDAAKGEEGKAMNICHPLKHGDFNHYSFWRRAYVTGDPEAPDEPAPAPAPGG